MKKLDMCWSVHFIFWATIALTKGYPAPNGTAAPLEITPLQPIEQTLQKKERQFFWEVTKTPSSGTDAFQRDVKSDIVDGNHPNLTSKITHEEIDTSVVEGQQSRRVKKILPPYHSDQHNEPLLVKRKRAREVEKIVEGSTEPLRPAVVEELTVVEIRHAADDIAAESPDKLLGDEASNAKSTDWKTEPAKEKIKPDQNEKHIFLNKFPDNVTEKDASLLQSPIQEINMQSTSHVTVAENKTHDAITKSNLMVEGDSNRETKAIVNAFEGSVTASNHNDPPIPQIQGIQLVPDQPDSRTMWDLIQEQLPIIEHIQDTHNTIYQEPRALPFKEPEASTNSPFRNFDTESAEVEYETENFHPGLSNIEKHELPFSYALPWLQVKDKEFDSKDNGKKSVEKFESGEDSSFPQSAHFTAVSSNEELRIPADLSKMMRMSETPKMGEDMAVRVVQSGATDPQPQVRTKWYLLLLTGNSTIVKRRRNDFTKYLRLNLAARLSVEYDDIKVNKLILAPPRVLVNISVYASSDDIAEESELDLKENLEEKGEWPLHKLAESNATLLELSGEEYRVVRFLSLQAPQSQAQHGTPPAAQAQREEPHFTAMSSRHEDIEFVIYTFLGSACACAVILTLFLAVNKYKKKWKRWEWPCKQAKVERPQQFTEEPETQCPIPPAVIYSGGFPQIRGSWMRGSSQPSAEPCNNSFPGVPLLQRYPGIELGANPPDSPRHNKLRMYNCRPDRVLVRKLPGSCVDVKSSSCTLQEPINSNCTT